MTSSTDRRKTILRNMLLGRWAAEQLGMSPQDAEAYSHALAAGGDDPEGGDVFNKVRKDFDAAGIARTDEQILQTMNELMLKAGRQLSSAQGNAIDGAAVALARNIKSR